MQTQGPHERGQEGHSQVVGDAMTGAPDLKT